MTLRTLTAVGALALALVTGHEAAAQTYRVAPEYGYRQAPEPFDDDEDYPGASPGTYGRPVPRAPVERPYYDEQRPRAPQGYTGSVPPQQGAYREQLPPPGEAGAGYQQPPDLPPLQRRAARPQDDQNYERAPQGYERAPQGYERAPQGYERAPQGAPQGRGPQDGARPPLDLGAREPAAREAREPRDQRGPRDPRDGAPSQQEVEAVQNGKMEDMDPRFRRQIVNYPSKEPAGTLIVDTANTYLYLVMEGGKAMRYGIGVGREGFTWNGRQKISRMKEWPDWYPPAEMIERQPYLPRWMAGGPSNPMGARALYLGNTLYRIHGTNDPTTIGKFVSSGCIRLFNEDVQDLYSRVQIGSNVVVLAKPGGQPKQLSPERLPGQPESPAASNPAPARPGANMTPRPRNGAQAQR